MTEDKPRYLFIDLYRGLVILFMLQGHVFRALLDIEIIQSPWFQFHDFFHGISAPAFLFGSGLTFVLATRKKWEKYHHWNSVLARRLNRLLIILLLGYILHLPFMSMRKIVVEGTQADYLSFFQSDVLQCIGFGLLLLHGLIFFFKTERRFYGLVLATTVGVPLLTPLIWQINFLEHFPPFFSQLMNSQHGSLFPLFPYVAFLFAGVLVSWEFMLAVEHNRADSFMKRFFVLGPVFILIGVFFHLIPIAIYPHQQFWFTSPNYFMIRIGALLVITSTVWFVVQKFKTLPKWITILGKESLLIYVVHLAILYGSVVNAKYTIKKIIGTNLTLPEVTITFTIFTLSMIGLAFFWDYLKREKTNTYRLIQLIIAGIFFTLFFSLDY